jgi:hypothetical protein
MCALLSLTATSHCLQDEKKTSKAAGKKDKGKGAGISTEAVTKKLSKAEAKVAEAKVEEGKKAEATVVDQPLDGDGNPVDTEECTVTMVEEDPTKKRKRSKR